MSSSNRTDHVHDLIGIGFGPANLALAIAIEESGAAGHTVDAAFFEQQPEFGWHRGMLIDGATMQVSFLKDLVTMRDPASSFSFLCYLHEQGRMADFINHKTLFPSRVEYHDYLEWAARRVDHLVRYDSEVVEVRPVHEDGVVRYLDVVVRHGGHSGEPAQMAVHRARNVVVAAGLEPRLPAGVHQDERIFHNLDLLPRVEALRSTAPRRLVVLGAGQSAAEATEYLHRTFPSAEICAVLTRYGYSPSDDSPFANRVFDPQAVDHFYTAPEDVKRMLLAYHANTNYSVVDLELIEELYRRAYQEQVRGVRRLRLYNASRLVAAESTAHGVHAEVEFLPTGERTELPADALVYATGCRPVDPLQLLGEAGEHCYRTDTGELQVERDYRARTTEDVTAAIYLQGHTEHAHGITATLLSNSAVRAGEILTSLRAKLAEQREARPARRAAPYLPNTGAPAR